MFRVSLVNLSNPSNTMTVEVSAAKWRDAMMNAQQDHPGFMAVEAEAVRPAAIAS